MCRYTSLPFCEQNEEIIECLLTGITISKIGFNFSLSSSGWCCSWVYCLLHCEVYNHSCVGYSGHEQTVSQIRFGMEVDLLLLLLLGDFPHLHDVVLITQITLLENRGAQAFNGRQLKKGMKEKSNQPKCRSTTVHRRFIHFKLFILSR